MEKRFQYWGFKDGKAQILWTPWFEWRSDYCPKYQLERHPKLLNEYR